MPADPIGFDPGLFWLNPTQAPDPAHRSLAPSDPFPPPHSPAPNHQRKYLRFRIDEAVARMYAKGLLTSIGMGRANAARAALNLSEGGVLVLSSERFRPDLRVLVRLEIEESDDGLECEGLVRWCGESARNPGYFFAGIAFRATTPALARQIGHLRAWFTSPGHRVRTSRRRPAGPSMEMVP